MVILEKQDYWLEAYKKTRLLIGCFIRTFSIRCFFFYEKKTKNVFHSSSFLLSNNSNLNLFFCLILDHITRNTVKTINRNAFFKKRSYNVLSIKPCFDWKSVGVKSLSYYRYAHFERFKQEWFFLPIAFECLNLSTPFSHRSLSTDNTPVGFGGFRCATINDVFIYFRDIPDVIWYPNVFH